VAAHHLVVLVAGVVDDGPPGAAVRATRHRRPAHTVVSAGVVETVISGQDVKTHGHSPIPAKDLRRRLGGNHASALRRRRTPDTTGHLLAVSNAFLDQVPTSRRCSKAVCFSAPGGSFNSNSWAVTINVPLIASQTRRVASSSSGRVGNHEEMSPSVMMGLRFRAERGAVTQDYRRAPTERAGSLSAGRALAAVGAGPLGSRR
jgi:hypothetical protein